MYYSMFSDVLPPETGTHHEEGVANPQAAPAHGTLRDAGVLTVNGDRNRRSLAYGAAAYVRFDFSFFHRHHGQWSGGRQPVGLIVSAGVVTNVSGVAVQEGHCAEAWEARACQTWRMKEKKPKTNKCLRILSLVLLQPSQTVILEV